VPDEKGYRASFDPLVVRTADLKAVLDRFIKDFKSRHDGKTEHHKTVYGATGGSGQMGERNVAYSGEFTQQSGYATWISEESGISQRRVYGILNLESKVTSLDIADKILQALEMTYVLHNGEVPVIPNPRWTQEHWVRWMNKRGCAADEGSEYEAF
jgi:hypothetical protein